MKRILFVDDEPRILDGLRRMLTSMRRDWEMVFADGGEAALAELETGAFDVIVSDMRMPGMDGAALLTHVQEKYPNTVRIVLSGHTEMEAALRAVPVAHQFLSKPTEAEVLRAVVERACNLQALLNDETLREVVGRVDVLPSAPRLYTELTRSLANPDVSLEDIAKSIEQDAAMSAKILQLVSSAFFGLPQRVSSITQAVTYLGTAMIKNIVLSVEVFREWQGAGGLSSFSLDAQQNHALLAAKVAIRLVKKKKEAEDAFVAAVLHDVGKLVLAVSLPDHLESVLQATREQERPMHVVEQELSGVTHAEIGAYLLGLWGLPYKIVEAVAHHHAPERVAHESFCILDAVHVANVLAHECAPGSPVETAGGSGEIDGECLARLGVIDELPAWREMAAEQAGMAAGA